MKFGEFLDQYTNLETDDTELEGYDDLLDEAIDELQEAYESDEFGDNELIEKVIKIKLSKFARRKTGRKFKFTSDKEGFKVVKKPGTKGEKPGDFKEVKLSASEKKAFARAAKKRARAPGFQRALAKGRAKAARLG